MKGKRIWVILTLLFVLTSFVGCIPKREDKQEISSVINSECEHEWVVVDWTLNYCGIYCPKCKFEITVTHKEWAKIQADMEYHAKEENK